MTKPSDFSPQTALEVSSTVQKIDRNVWILRITGAILLAAGWAVVALPHLGESGFLVDTAVIGALGLYAFTAAAQSRRTAVNLERKLRLELLVHNMELQNLAMRDDLTQLFNRRHFFERLEKELATAKGFQRPLAVMLIDLDGMKLVNDTYGYHVGDSVLAAFGSFLLSHTRGSDLPARIGGDEFAIILPDTSESAAELLMSRFIEHLANTDLFEQDTLTLNMTACFGVSGFPWGGETEDAIIREADAAKCAFRRARAPQSAVRQVIAQSDRPIPAMFLRDGDPAEPEPDRPE